MFGRRRSRGTTWVEQDRAKPFPLCLFRAAEINNERTLLQLGSKPPTKPSSLSEALCSSIANRSPKSLC